MTTKILAFLEENEPKKQAIDEALKVINEEIKNKTEELNTLTYTKHNSAGNISENIKKIATLRAELAEFKKMKDEKINELKELIHDNYYGGLERYVVSDMNKPLDDIIEQSNKEILAKLREFEKEIKELQKQAEQRVKEKTEELKEVRKRISIFMVKDNHYTSNLISMLSTNYSSVVPQIINVTEWIK